MIFYKNLNSYKHTYVLSYEIHNSILISFILLKSAVSNFHNSRNVR